MDRNTERKKTSKEKDKEENRERERGERRGGRTKQTDRHRLVGMVMSNKATKIQQQQQQ